jgi:Ca-activated chloride channel homolog
MAPDPVLLPGALRWAAPQFLLLLPLIVLPWWLRLRMGSRGGVRFPDLAAARGAARGLGQRWRHLVPALQALALAGLICALARPQGELHWLDRTTQGLDLVVALDVSDSMRADDLRPDRLEAAKRMLAEFIRARPGDRMGLVIFSGATSTAVPLTSDHEALLAALSALRPGAVGVEGTAIGDGLLTALNRLLSGGGDGRAAKSRVIVLATDGVNNQGYSPTAAALGAAQKGVRVYVIGLGGTRPVPRWEAGADGRRLPMRDVFGQPVLWEPLNEPELRILADMGKGRFFRAATEGELAAVLAEIATLEQTRLRQRGQVTTTEAFAWPLGLALVCFLAARVLALTRFRVLA